MHSLPRATWPAPVGSHTTTTTEAPKAEDHPPTWRSFPDHPAAQLRRSPRSLIYPQPRRCRGSAESVPRREAPLPVPAWHREPTCCSTGPEAVHRGHRWPKPSTHHGNACSVQLSARGPYFSRPNRHLPCPPPTPGGDPTPPSLYTRPYFLGFRVAVGGSSCWQLVLSAALRLGFSRLAALVGLPPSLRSVAIRGVCLRPLYVGFCYP